MVPAQRVQERLERGDRHRQEAPHAARHYHRPLAHEGGQGQQHVVRTQSLARQTKGKGRATVGGGYKKGRFFALSSKSER